MAQATLSVNIDSQDMECFEEFCNNTGLNPSTAINMFIKAVIRKQRLPFKVKGDPFYSEANMKRLRESIADAEAGRYTIHDPIEVS